MADRRAERHAATKAEIVQAAWELCREGGLGSLALRDLARRVRMQAPSLYSYFDSKHAIYDAMFAEGSQEILDLLPDLTDEADPHAGLRRLARTFVSFGTADPVRYQLLFQRTIPGFEPSPASYALALETFERVRKWFTAVGLGATKHLDLFTAITTGIVDQQIANEPGGTRWVRLVDDAVVMFLHHALPHGAHQYEANAGQDNLKIHLVRCCRAS